MSPKVGIILINWNGLDDTIECLESLKKITYPNAEVVVVDNASSGNDVEVLRNKHGSYIHLIANDKNYGFSEGNNIGMRYALESGCDYVVLLNNDTVVAPDLLTELVAVASTDPRIGIESAKVYFYDPPNRLWTVGGRVNWLLGGIKEYGYYKVDVGQYDEIADRDYVYATAMLIKREVMNAISLLDSSFFFGIEEYDYCHRAIKAGFRVVYVPKAKVWHKIGASRKKLADYPETRRQIKQEAGLMNYKHFYRLFRKHSPPLFFPIAFTRAALQYVVLRSVLDWVRGRK